jgi:hypothetical protein
LVDPAGQAYPGVHSPEHAAVVRPGVEPKVPPGQSTHAAAPASEYRPTVHRVAVALMDPAGQAYPGVHVPVHVDSVSPVVAPK